MPSKPISHWHLVQLCNLLLFLWVDLTGGIDASLANRNRVFVSLSEPVGTISPHAFPNRPRKDYSSLATEHWVLRVGRVLGIREWGVLERQRKVAFTDPLDL